MDAPLHASQLSACGIRTRVLQGGVNLRATEAVVFVHGNPGSGEDWSGRTPVLGELQQWLTNRVGFKWALRKGSPRGLPDAFLDRMYDDLDAGTRRAILKLYRATSEPDQRAELLAQLLRPHGWPTLVVWGAADPYLPAKLAEQQQNVFAQAEVVLLPDSGHFPFADNPEGVAQAVVPFLARQLLGAQSAFTPSRNEHA